MPFDMNQLGSEAAGLPALEAADTAYSGLDAPINHSTPPSARRGEKGQSESPAGDPEDFQVEEQEDGSAVVIDSKAAAKKRKTDEFAANLADDGTLDELQLNRLGVDLVEAVESDARSREERDKTYAEGLKRTGLNNDAPGGAGFDGASKVVHPMLSKGCVDFASRAGKELYPPKGPCKTQIVGKETDEKLDRAERKKTYMNWQLMTQVTENRPYMEKLLSQLPLGGSQYKFWCWNKELKRPTTEAVYVDDVFLPYGCGDFQSAYRATWRQYVSDEEFQRRVRTGLYRDLQITPPPASMNDKSEARAASDSIEGVEEDAAAYNENGQREILMAFVDTDLDDADGYAPEGRSVPYIVHIDKWSKRVLGVYRNWKDKDARFAKKPWMVEYTFIPWRGAQGVGLYHLIGTLSVAGTGAIRALLDAAQISNFPGAVKLKAGRNSGQSVQVNAGEIAELDAPPGVDDVRKLVMPFPFNGPSATLFQLLEWLTQQAESVVTTASERIAEGGGADMPVGTAMALIENDSSNFSAIHTRLHHSLKQELAILHRLNAENLEDEEVIEDLGELVVYAEDFAGPVDIIPVSDPNIFSEAQRYAQMQAVMQLSADPRMAPYFEPDRLLLRMMKLLQISDAEDFANLPKDPEKLSAVEENYRSAARQDQTTPLRAYESQDDLLHLQTHVHFMTSPIFGGSELIGAQSLQALIPHCKEHLVNFYRKHTRAASQAMLEVAKMQGLQVDAEEAEGRGAAFADAAIAQALGPMIMPGLLQAQKQFKGMQKPPPPSPDVSAREEGETKRKQMQLQYDQQRDSADRAAEQSAAQLIGQVEAAQIASNEKIAQLTQQMALLQDENRAEAQRSLAQLQTEGKAQLIVLQEFVAGLATQMNPPDLGAQIQPLLDSATQQTQQMQSQVEGLGQQQAQTQQILKQVLDKLLAPPAPGLMSRLLGGGATTTTGAQPTPVQQPTPQPQAAPPTQATQPGPAAPPEAGLPAQPPPPQ